jgi:hypothetical protein
VVRFLAGDFEKSSHSQENKPLTLATWSGEDPSVVTFALEVVPSFRGKKRISADLGLSHHRQFSLWRLMQHHSVELLAFHLAISNLFSTL